jgi:hypothetical protein
MVIFHLLACKRLKQGKYVFPSNAQRSFSGQAMRRQFA